MLEFQNVSAGYGAQDVLHGLTFTLQSGANYCLLGPNGCGKTTLLRAIDALIPHRGRILLSGEEVSSIPRERLASRLALMSQSHEVYFSYTVQETVLLGRYRRMKRGLFRGASREDLEAVEQCLETVGLCDLRRRPIDQLSGGQLQRVFLARALAQEPDVILLDEPANHLDVRHQVELIDYLKQWSRDGRHMVIGVFHDVNLALRLSENLLFLRDGRLLRAGQFEEICDRAFLREVFGLDLAGYMLDSLETWRRLEI